MVQVPPDSSTFDEPYVVDEPGEGFHMLKSIAPQVRVISVCLFND